MQRSVKLLRELVWYVVGAYVVRGNSKPDLPCSALVADGAASAVSC
jgi:hypothetical protein